MAEASVDFINPPEFTRDPSFIQRALNAALATAVVKARLKARKTPVVYANDHWGKWHSSVRTPGQRWVGANRSARQADDPWWE
jgi:hypothetical protein